MIAAFIIISITGFVAGGGAAVTIFRTTRERLLKERPVIHEQATSILTGTIARFERRELDAAPRRPALESPKKAKKTPAPAPIATTPQNNLARWGHYKTKAPLILEGVQVLATLASLSKLTLSVEDSHNIDLLSNQTNEMLMGFVNTPASIRNMPSVEGALWDQLAEIQKSVTSIQVEGAERIVREAKISTEFIKSKFNNPED